MTVDWDYFFHFFTTDRESGRIATVILCQNQQLAFAMRIMTI